MGEKLVIGPINKGLRTDRLPFAIDNDSFPTLINAYQWRGRVKRKRGTSLLGRLSRFIGTTDGSGNLTVTIAPAPIISGTVSFTIGTDVFTDPGGAGPVNTLITNGAGAGTLNITTGLLTITGSKLNTAVIYFPTLPVMGLEDLILNTTLFPGTLAFDTDYSYNITTTSPYNIYDVSFYKNPLTGSYPGYVAKSAPTPTTWNGQNYQQFWTVNYQGALWATNGINIPFSPTSVGMQFAPAATITFNSSTATTINVTITNCPLVIGDFVFANEWGGTNGASLNFQTGYVTACAPNTTPLATKTMTITFPNAAIGAILVPGILQYLTNRSSTTVDCLRWYDGDPTNGSSTNPVYNTPNGWVNFAPPLSQTISQGTTALANLPPGQYYLVGARMIVPYKDRLLFLGPVVQTSAAGSQVYLPDTIIYSENGTAYYSASFTGVVNAVTTIFNSILVPVNQSGRPPTYFTDQTGFGGFITAGFEQPIVTVGSNEDSLIIGFGTLQTQLVYSGNDVLPFTFFLINSELGSVSTFSSIIMDNGVITRGNRGMIITNQRGCERFDTEILDQVFEMNNINNGQERLCAQRDFINEWIYFTYPSNDSSYTFPNQTLLFNYRDNSWAIFDECYTTYGAFRRVTGYTWNNPPAPTWNQWTMPWNTGSTNLLQRQIIGGNQQGFVLTREDSTQEGNSLYIQNISGNTITAPNHCLNDGDYIVISGCLGSIASNINGKIFLISNATSNTFTIDQTPSGSYLGGGLILRMYIPYIQTKQFPVAWGMGRKTRIGAQQYLLTTTANAQIQLLIFLSQDDENAYNNSPIVPQPNSINNSLIYSTILYTCPESTNLGLTPANINLQTPTATSQQQLWHRMNTSLIGDTVQIGFTMDDAQMRSLDDNGNYISQFAEIEIHGMILDVSPSQLLV